jgi:hypothetical protein
VKPSKPPALAAWMLEHLLWGGKNEALAGDLLEEFQRRRSTAWYWRQVLFAIFDGISGALRAHWLVLSVQIVFAAAWVWVSAYCDAAVNGYFIAWGLAHYRYAWVVWTARSTVLVVALPLGIYLAAARGLSLRTYARGLAAGWSVWVIIFVGGNRSHTALYSWPSVELVVPAIGIFRGSPAFDSDMGRRGKSREVNKHQDFGLTGASKTPARLFGLLLATIKPETPCRSCSMS